MSNIETQIQELKVQIQASQDKNNARAKEYQNILERQNKEYIQMYDNGSIEVATIIIDALDNLERALNIESSDKKYTKELTKIDKDLRKTLKQIGVSEIDCECKNDPNYHHAVAIGSDSSLENDMILEVYQKGYMFKEKLIRPAMVKVNQK